ncbi:MAG: pyridine nucleotide-disulfide oxidoreductase [Parvularculaceae bacterium]
MTPRKENAGAGSIVFAALIVAALAWGWGNSNRFFTAESGAGYFLGIAGAVSMLLLLAYPARKHARFMRRAGPVGAWFRLHMALGLLGPTLILYHSNFSLGSLNSNVALWSMLTVAGSGLFGRFFYAKIHRGLYGHRAQMRELLAEAAAFRASIAADLDPALHEKLDKIEAAAFADASDMFAAARKAVFTVAAARSAHKDVRRRLKQALKRSRREGAPKRASEIRNHLSFASRYFTRVEQGAEIAFYERLFAAWHFLHLPLFILLLITMFIHVIAVHFY